MGIFTEGPDDWPEPTCEEMLKAERKRNSELQKQISRLSSRIQEDITEQSEAIWWLSFADEEKGFLGVSIVKGWSFLDASINAHNLDINPGGEVQGCEVTGIPEKHHNRLLTKEEAGKLSRGPK